MPEATFTHQLLGEESRTVGCYNYRHPRIFAGSNGIKVQGS
jgi:hypothetical protein